MTNGTLVAKEESDKKGINSNRVKLKIAGEWRLWGRRPLTI